MLTFGGEVWCQETKRRVPDQAQRVFGIEDAIAIDVGGHRVCAVTRNSHVRCRRGSERRARRVLGVRGAVAVSVGSDTCARTGEGEVFCWGRRLVARRVTGIDAALDVADDGWWRWIVERSGRVVGISKNGIEPVAGLDDAVTVAVGSDRACVLRSSGAVSCWHTRPSRSPLEVVEIRGIEAASELALGDRRACVHERGATRCWGRNENFELGEAQGRRWWDEAGEVRCQGANRWQANPASPMPSFTPLEVAADRRVRIIEARD